MYIYTNLLTPCFRLFVTALHWFFFKIIFPSYLSHMQSLLPHFLPILNLLNLPVTSNASQKLFFTRVVLRFTTNWCVFPQTHSCYLSQKITFLFWFYDNTLSFPVWYSSSSVQNLGVGVSWCMLVRVLLRNRISLSLSIIYLSCHLSIHLLI